ncbi:hypothetical protein GQ43DRAFT_13617 [Delitschia confertaspora ATCC 74209]|uniref:Uncharacterized protein n=1 Tax=Delitschia confertaspora ATCC 74209 TaxID=1513339 RepID=A0A9P4JPH3_9PLEO|nr:hypothetical protein GQ43DRAFT_13617 [Delitschia confertaspora ATCC 74209]
MVWKWMLRRLKELHRSQDTLELVTNSAENKGLTLDEDGRLREKPKLVVTCSQEKGRGRGRGKGGGRGDIIGGRGRGTA